MGCCNSRLEMEEAVSRCKARRRYMKHLVEGRRVFAAAHSLYLRTLRSTGSALVQFANAEAQLHHHPISPPPSLPSQIPPPPPPPLSPISVNWTTSSVDASPILPPPPPPQYSYSGWDFWDPFAAASPPTSANVGEWEESSAADNSISQVPLPPISVVRRYSKDPATGLAVVVVPRGSKGLSEIVRELDEYFLKAGEAGGRVSLILEAPNCATPSGKVCSYSRNLSPFLSSWVSNSTTAGFRKCGGTEGAMRKGSEVGAVCMSHSSTVEKLYAWEKKLYLEVKNFERSKEEHETRVGLLRRQEAKGVDYVKIEKNRREIERLESKMMVASQAMETTSSEIIMLRESELFPQLLELVHGLMCMWRSMYECHQVQVHIVQQLEHLTSDSSTNPTTDSHRQATLQLELEVDHWYSAFCSVIKTHRDYLHSLTGWLRLSLFQCHQDPLAKTTHKSNIYSLCEQWQLALDQIPDKVASEGIKSFLTVVHSIVAQQTQEQKQRKRSDFAFKELEKRADELRSMEVKHRLCSESEEYWRSPVTDKKAKVEALKVRAEEERSKYEKSSGVTRAMTLNNLQTGFPNVLQAMTGFSNACTQAFESVYNHPRGLLEGSGCS